ATPPPPALLDLGVGTRLLVYRDAEARVFVQRLGYPEAQRFDFSGLGAEAPAQISGLALAPDDSVLAMSFKTADGRARSALLDVRTRSVMRHFAGGFPRGGRGGGGAAAPGRDRRLRGGEGGQRPALAKGPG